MEKCQEAEAGIVTWCAEVDYVVQYGADIVPLEVKSATRGSMQSMFQFLSEKNYSYGIVSSISKCNFTGVNY